MFENTPPDLVARLQATSYAMSLRQDFQDIADEVYELSAKGTGRREIDRRIHEWMKERGICYDAWRDEMVQVLKGSPLEGVFDLHKLWLAYGVEPWLRECVRSIAFTNEPIPFLPFAAGYWIEQADGDEPQLIAVMTPLTDPHLAAKQLIEKHKQLFGKRASGSPRKDEVDNARMLAMHREGMSYKEIAIQNLREKHPDVVSRPDRYRAPLKTERERVAKAVSAADKLWKERGVESSIAD